MPKAKASLLVILTTLMSVTVLFMLPYTPRQVVRTAVAHVGELERSVLLTGVIGYAKQQPCISLQAGRVERVYAECGQRVHKGDLLFSLDISEQEKALAALRNAVYRQQTAVGDSLVAAALTQQQTLEWYKTEQELIQSIEAAQIRAEMDGVVEAVYIQPGDYVEAAGLLGIVRDEERCVTAAANPTVLQGIGLSAPAILEDQGQSLGAARLERIGRPDDGEALIQQAIFLPAAQEQLATCIIGDTVSVNLLRDTLEGHVLIPLSAVDAQSKVWYVDNGTAKAERIDTSKRNADFVAVAQDWEGRHVILDPEGIDEGCPVKEAGIL